MTKKLITNSEAMSIIELCRKKVIEDSVPDTYMDIAKKVFDDMSIEDHGEEKIQYWVQGIALIGEMLKESQIEELGFDYRDIVEEINVAEENLKMTKYQLSDKNRERNAQLRQMARDKQFMEELKDAIKALVKKPSVSVKLRETPSKSEYVLTIADIHCGAKVTSENNEYSVESLKERFQILRQKMDKKIKEYGIRKLKVLTLGDSIQGILRLSDLANNELTIPESITLVSNEIADFLAYLSDNNDVIIDYHHVTSSNHTEIRVLNSRAGSLPKEDLERIVLGFVRGILRKYENINIIEETGFRPNSPYMGFKIFDFNCFCCHGHAVKVKLEDIVAKVSGQKNIIYSYGFIAHSHGEKTFSFGEDEYHTKKVFVAPCFMGSDEYADSLFVGVKGTCNLYKFDEIEGHVCTENLMLQNPNK